MKNPRPRVRLAGERTAESDPKPLNLIGHHSLAQAVPVLEPHVSVTQICAALGVSRRFIEQLRVKGAFPPPDVMLGRAPRWRVSTIQRFLSQQAKEGDA
jgi:predicted DNA-binding transcriptional regulator AlpA